METFSAKDPAGVKKAAAALGNGKVLLVPTETVYGLVCDWFDPGARAVIYGMKHRSENKPLAAFVPDVSAAEKIAGIALPEAAKRLAERYMPGPITLIVYDKDGKTFGFRIPDHPFILNLLKEYGGALASTSANLSGQPAAVCVTEALKSLAEPPFMVLDDGPCPAGSKPSAVVLVEKDDSVRILRSGTIPDADILYFSSQKQGVYDGQI